MTDWCSRPLDGVYAAILVDAVMVKPDFGHIPALSDLVGR